MQVILKKHFEVTQWQTAVSTLPCVCCNPWQHHCWCLLVNVQTIPLLTSTYLSWKSLLAISFTQESTISLKHQQQCPTRNSKATKKVLVGCWFQHYKNPSVGSFLKAVSNKIYNIVQESRESGILSSFQKCLCIKNQESLDKVDSYSLKKKNQKSKEKTHPTNLSWDDCSPVKPIRGVQPPAVPRWIELPLTTAAESVALISHKALESRLGLFWTLLFARFWSFSEV